ncbi:MAG: DUF1772 domain-containing protein [Actinomycetota bacterium]|nr:DUF1772 domain-containing protein [Actinomycetota bacterium]
MNAADVMPALTVASAVGCSLTAGVMFAFSTSVMPGLGRLPAPHAIAAMNSMNKAILNPLFLFVFMGTTVLCVAAAALTPFADIEGGAWQIAGAVLYLLGIFGLTMAGNVPMNDHLMTLDPDAAESVKEWNDYLSRWTRFNHIRALTGTAGALALTISALAG